MIVPADNPTTVEGAALGRTLYYDRRMSPDGSRACADCHLQRHGFAHPDVPGVLPHINLAWSRSFLWDGHFEGTLEDAMRMEVEDFFQTDLERLRQPDLQALFEAAFGSPEITVERTARALAQFQRTMFSGRTPYDAYEAGERSALNAAEKRGMRLFFDERAECFHCHASALFTDNGFHDIGLDPDPTGTGRGAYTGRPEDAGKWKTPTLRNVERSGPYMHDDRFETLEEVVAYYSDGVGDSPNLDPLLRRGGFGLTASEQADLVAFLKALTDEDYLTDPRLGPP
jgi:cytochrome c peroxidase